MRAAAPSRTKSKLPSASSASTIDAAALQDHLLRSLSVDLSTPGPSKVKLPASGSVANSSKRFNTATSTVSQRLGGIKRDTASTESKGATIPSLTAIKKPDDLTTAIAGSWMCEKCNCMALGATCNRCGDARATDYAAKAPKLTLAQQRGLVAAPPALLTSVEWENVERMAVARSASGTDACCAICMEAFGMREQVLLSCSHTFHRTCLESFEKFVGAEKVACPMCRTKNYQKRRTRHAAVQYVQTCIVKVQSVYRGYVTRKQFLQLRRALYFDGSGGMAVGIDGSRRRALAAGMLNDINRRLKVNAIKKDQQLKTLFHELDRSVEASREIMRQMEAKLALRSGIHSTTPVATTTAVRPSVTIEASESDSSASNVLLQELATRLLLAEERAAALQAERRRLLQPRPVVATPAAVLPVALPTMTEESWRDVYETCRLRNDISSDCAICMCALSDGRGVTVLSCTHIFHDKCMQSLEMFVDAGRGAAAASATAIGVDVIDPIIAAPSGCRCPMCRSVYLRRHFPCKRAHIT